MRGIRDRWSRLRGVTASCVLLPTAACLAGCGGGSGPSASNAAAQFEGAARAPYTMTARCEMPNEWIDMIEEAGLPEYAQLGRTLLAQGRVRVVTPPTLHVDINAYAFINTREIWINTPMFERYPDVIHRATIFLHELIHIHSGEATHLGPWWVAQDQFFVYFRDRETPTPAAFDPASGGRVSSVISERVQSPCDAQPAVGLPDRAR